MTPADERTDESDAVSRQARPSIAELRAVCQPQEVLGRRSGEHWLGHYMRRPSIFVTSAAVRLGMTANAVTAVMIVVGLAGAALFAVPGLIAAIAGALLVQTYLLLDCSDGEVARWRGTSSASGIYLDRVGHYVTEAALFVALGYRAGDGDASWVIVGLATALLAVLVKAETDLVDVARARFGLAAAADESVEINARPLAAGRRLAEVIPIHRSLGAVEASLLAVTAAVVDQFLDGIPVTRGLVVALLIVAAAMIVLHLVSILASSRLRA